MSFAAAVAGAEAVPPSDWIDVGLERTPGGQVSHVWLHPMDVRAYCDALRAEIHALKCAPCADCEELRAENAELWRRIDAAPGALAEDDP